MASNPRWRRASVEWSNSLGVDGYAGCAGLVNNTASFDLLWLHGATGLAEEAEAVAWARNAAAARRLAFHGGERAPQ